MCRVLVTSFVLNKSDISVSLGSLALASAKDPETQSIKIHKYHNNKHKKKLQTKCFISQLSSRIENEMLFLGSFDSFQ